MGNPGPGAVVLFLGSDPMVAEERAHLPRPIGGVARLGMPVVGPQGKMDRKPTTGPLDEAGYPADQLMCAEIVLGAAERQGRRVQVVDVNDAGEAQGLVQQLVGETDVLPLLVRADGHRLVGTEAFTRASVRSFLQGA